MYFEPIKFIENLKYMGVGMLGVLMIVAIIMGATYLVSYVTNTLAERKANGSEDDSTEA